MRRYVKTTCELDCFEAVDSRLLLHTDDDSCLVFQHKDIKTIQQDLNQDFQLKLIGLFTIS